MRSWSALITLAIGLFGCVGHNGTSLQEYTVEASVMKAANEPFLRHEQPVPFGSYLAMSFPFAPVLALHEAIEAKTSLALIHRGEAHVTVVTPVEFDTALKVHLSIAAINDLAEAARIQSSPLQMVCVGRGEKAEAGETLTTYFIVVDADSLLGLRRKIHAAFVSAGGDPAAFAPEAFYPHVTVGFTKRDLHLEDGIKKDRNSCVADLVLN